METKNVFTEKYRPSSLDDIIGQEKIVKVLKRFVEKGDMPHLLFSGEPGTGKTSSSLALANELYGSQWHRNFFELNASDENGVDVMRGKIKDYTKIMSMSHPFKLLFLDESDYLSNSSQSVLRRTIEDASDTCRFILSCNYPNKIIPAIADRCAVFRFQKLSAREISVFLRKVRDTEGIDMSDSAISTLATLSKGSMRRGLNMIQTLTLSTDGKITDDDVYDYMYWIDYEDVRKLLECVKVKSLKSSDAVLDRLINKKCFATKEIVSGLYQEIKEHKEFNDYFKIRALDKLNSVEYHISVGADPEIQLRTYMAYLMKLYGG